MQATITKCDVCHETIPPDVRSFRLVADVSVRNSHVRRSQSCFPDICGRACLAQALSNVADDAEHAEPQTEPVPHVGSHQTGWRP